MASAIDCMPIGLIYDAGLTGCESATSLLRSLAIFNVWTAVLSIVLGHDKVRKWLPSCSCSEKWGPYSSIALSCIHPFLMLVSTITIRVNGFYPNPLMVFAVWTMRPRLVITPILYVLCLPFAKPGKPNPYLWTFKDNVIEETLLNVFSLPFALLFILERNDKERNDKERNDKDSGACEYDSSYLHFWRSFYVIAAVGVISLVILLVMITKGLTVLCTSRNKDKDERLTWFWRLTLFFSGLNMFAAFAGQWVLWGTFITNAGTDFCPGSLVGEIASWAIGLTVIALSRGVIGGPYN